MDKARIAKIFFSVVLIIGLASLFMAGFNISEQLNKQDCYFFMYNYTTLVPSEGQLIKSNIYGIDVHNQTEIIAQLDKLVKDSWARNRTSALVGVPLLDPNIISLKTADCADRNKEKSDILAEYFYVKNN